MTFRSACTFACHLVPPSVRPVSSGPVYIRVLGGLPDGARAASRHAPITKTDQVRPPPPRPPPPAPRPGQEAPGAGRGVRAVGPLRPPGPNPDYGGPPPLVWGVVYTACGVSSQGATRHTAHWASCQHPATKGTTPTPTGPHSNNAQSNHNCPLT